MSTYLDTSADLGAYATGRRAENHLRLAVRRPQLPSTRGCTGTKGQELEVRIDSLAYGGNGVGRVDGFVVFVRAGSPATSCVPARRR